MLDTTKINYSHKRLVGKQHTANTKAFYEEEDGVVLYQHAKEIWIDKIDSIIPTSSTDLIKVYKNLKLVEDETVQGRKSFYAVDGEGNKINGFIPPSYGINYNVSLEINGKKIPSSHASNWIFDYANGVLTFETTPPTGDVKISAFQYVGRTFSQYLDNENNSVARGVLGVDTPSLEYTIQHNMASFDVDVVIYVFDEVDGQNYWKKDVVPLIIEDENRVRLQLTEEQPIRFIIKSYATPEWI